MKKMLIIALILIVPTARFLSARSVKGLQGHSSQNASRIRLEKNYHGGT